MMTQWMVSRWCILLTGAYKGLLLVVKFTSLCSIREKQATGTALVDGCLFCTDVHACMPIMHSNKFMRCEELQKKDSWRCEIETRP